MSWVTEKQHINVVVTTKALAAAGNYAADDVLSENASTGTVWTWAEVVNVNGGAGEIIGAIASSKTNAVRYRPKVFLYNATPAATTELNDNATNNAPVNSDVSAGTFVGTISFPSLSENGGNTISAATPNSSTSGLPLVFKAATNADDLIGVVITQDAETNETATDDLTITFIVRDLNGVQ